MKTITKILQYDDHRDSSEPNSISVTTLLGPMYKAGLYIAKTPKTHELDIVLKRSSFIGTACHSRMEHILSKEEGYTLEKFTERKVTVDGIEYTIAGSCDIIRDNGDGTHTMMDLKTGYGAKRNEAALEKDAMQMALYRWLNQDEFNIQDTAYTLWMSQSNNSIDEIPVQMKCVNEIQVFIEEKLWAIANNTKVDCNEGVKYNSCNYCEYTCEYRV